MTPLPSGTVTFLFTDLEGSTRLWEEHPEAMQVALSRHDEIVRDAIAQHGGRVVKTTGDGAHAVFADALGAAQAAVSAQLALAAELWPATGPLRVRMGIHSGLATERDGDYYGPSLNRAARLMAAAHGGQVVVSLVTGELLRDRLPNGLELSDLGEHRLRDLDRPERILQLAHPALPRDFPSLTSAGAPKGNLPTQVTSFVGREEDLTRVAALLADSRLVTLIGVGGVGKTRLALQVASDVSDHHTDGTWFVDLAAVPDDESVPLAVATALTAPVSTGTVSAESVAVYIGDRSLLVVLDNCEHVVDAVGELAEHIVRRCPAARVLATSREGLAVSGEYLWPVRPLGLPADDGDAADSAPVQLFADRVRALRPDFELEASNTESVIEICRRLDGLPLAIELAAARARSLTPHDIAERLDKRFALLSGGKRRGVARHETLRAAVDWSYELLDADERTVLTRVSVFAGGFSLEAAEAVVGSGSVVDALDRLVDKSLLAFEGEREISRFRMLETIRQYALEKLDESGDTAAARERHLHYMVAFASEASAGLLGPDEAAWHRRTEDELDNLRSAVAWAAETGDAASALLIATAFSGQAYLRYTWGLETLATTAAEIPGAREHSRFPLALAMTAIRRATEGAYDDAVALGEETLILATEDTPDHCEARAKAEMMLGDISLRGDARDDAAAHYERAVEYAAGSAVSSTAVMARHLYACALPNRGAEHLDAAELEAERSYEAATATGSPSMIAQADFAVGYIGALRGDPGAVEPLRRASRSVGPNRGGALGVLALFLGFTGDLADALDTATDAIRLSRDSGDRSMVSVNVDLLVPLLMRRGDTEGAATLLGTLEEGALPHVRRTGLPGQRRDRAIDRIAARIPADEVVALRAVGAAMNYDDAVAFALDRIAIARTGLEARS